MKTSWRWILSDLKFNKRFTVLFIVNLALGLTGYLTLDGFRHQLESSLEAKSKLVLGADLGISARHPLNDKHKAAAQDVLQGVPSTDMIETYSMLASEKGDSRLVQIKAIENAFPFFGNIQLRSQGEMNPQREYEIITAQKMWVYPEVLPQLGVEVGDRVKLGETFFEIADIVEDDSASGFSTSMAPRVYIGKNQLGATGLITAQSLAWYSTLYKTGLSEIDLKAASEEIFEQPAIEESIRVYTHKNVSEQMSRMLSYLSDYLGLVSIAAIFLASIGAAFLFRSYITSKIKEVAVFRSLGLTSEKVLRIYVAEVVLLGFAAALLAWALSVVLSPLIVSLLQNLVAVPLVLTIRPEGVGVAIALGVLGSVMICLPVLVQMRVVRPAVLFQAGAAQLKDTVGSSFFTLVGVLLLWLLSVWQSHSWVVGSAFMGGFIACGLILGTIAYATLWLCNRFGQNWPLLLRLPIRNLVRQPKSTISCFLALGLGVLLLNVIPQIEASIQGELERPDQSKLPSLFLFDIQDDQVEQLKSVVAATKGSLGTISPMIRSRLVEVNGREFETTNANKEQFSREEEREARFRNRGFNLSYRTGLSESEQIVDGVPFSGTFDPLKDEIAEVSVETRFADRLGLKLGDVVKFEIQSVPVEAKIVNLRSVRWTSFQPNFFLQFQPGVLEEAPKSYVASIEDLSMAKKIEMQNEIVKKLPNVSIIDVTRIVKRLSTISDQMSVALQFMAALCILVGFLVMYSIASHQANQRKWDINLVKVLGAPFGMIRSMFVMEFSLLAAMAGAMGVLLSIGLSYGISSLLFDTLWLWDPVFPVVSLLVLVGLVLVLSYLSIRTVLRARASFYLR